MASRNLLSCAFAMSALAFTATSGFSAEQPAEAEDDQPALLNLWHAIQGADQSSDIIAVKTFTFNGYKRTKLPDGHFRPETYAFGEGGFKHGGVAGEPAEDLKFIKVARTIAGPLATQGYVPTPSADKTDLLIVVYWGVTNQDEVAVPGVSSVRLDSQVKSESFSLSTVRVPGVAAPTTPAGSLNQPGADDFNNNFDHGFFGLNAVQNDMRDKANFDNARLLGYWQELDRTKESFFLRDRYMSYATELADPRYYVVLTAFRFQDLYKQKRRVLQWSAHYSIRVSRNDFERDLAAMTLRASKYFGQDSKGLQRNLRFRGTVDIGEPQVVEYDTAPVGRIGPVSSGQPTDQKK
ncbi:MAG TPA: hypothetical protein VFJ90_10645 [Candidatus Didemnitutus sp.]|nr:hypothetical protein [Candidatus Didemnitutus sp.]